MKFSKLMDLVKGCGVVVGEVSVGGDPEILGVAEDSRKVKAGDLFVVRGGSKTSGAKFVADAVGRGAVAVVGNAECEMRNAKGVAFASVGDANLAAAVLAHEAAGNPTAGMKVIGITGTKGKTTVAYFLRSVLKAAGMRVGMIGTVEIDDGKDVVPAEMTTPGSVELVELFSRMKANGVTHCVMEVSSHALHQHRVSGIDWAVAIFTNLTGDHLDYHKTMEEYAAAKAKLFEALREGAVAIVNGDDMWAKRMMANCRAKVVPYRVELPPSQGPVYSPIPRGVMEVENGCESGDAFAALVMHMAIDGMKLHVRGNLGPPPKNGLVFHVGTPLIGKHNAYNVLAAIAACVQMGMYDSWHDGISSSSGAPGRLQAVVCSGMTREEMPFQAFVDYAHTHDALENVLKAMRATMGEGRLICVFGCGGDRDRTKRPKMGAVAERLADVAIVTSDNPRTEEPGGIIEEICAGFSSGWKNGGKIRVEPDRRAAIRMAIGEARKGDVVLIAGKGHENYQIIGTTKHHFDDVEEAETALRDIFLNHQDTKAPS